MNSRQRKHVQQFLEVDKHSREYKIVLAKINNWTIPSDRYSRDDLGILEVDHVKEFIEDNRMML
eukprot:3693040-Rhodomonas_salina.1